MGLMDMVHDVENRLKRKQPKVLYAGNHFEGQPVMVINEKEIILAADKNNAVRVDPQFGVLLGGKISFSATPEQISIAGGYWRLNPLLLTCIASTTPTPISTLVKSKPELLQGMAQFASSLDFLKGFSN